VDSGTSAFQVTAVEECFLKIFLKIKKKVVSLSSIISYLNKKLQSNNWIELCYP